MSEGTPPVFLSALQHFSYLPVSVRADPSGQVFDDNEFTVRGTVRTGEVIRELPLYSEKYHLVEKADVLTQ